MVKNSKEIKQLLDIAKDTLYITKYSVNNKMEYLDKSISNIVDCIINIIKFNYDLNNSIINEITEYCLNYIYKSLFDNSNEVLKAIEITIQAYLLESNINHIPRID